MGLAPSPAASPAVSTGHIGWSWTFEGGVVEVHRIGDSIARSPISTPLDGRGVRSGREWWPARADFEPMWRPLTFATFAEAAADRAEKGVS